MTARARIGLLVIAAAILVVAFILLRPSGDDSDETAATPTATATATAADTATPAAGETETPTPKPTVDPGPVLTGSSVQKLRVTKGETVRFRVRAPQDTEVHIHGYDIKRDVKAGETTPIAFKATIDGIFEIEFEDTATQIAELRVDP